MKVGIGGLMHISGFDLSVFIANTRQWSGRLFGGAPGVEGDNEWDNLSIGLAFTPQTSTQSNGIPNAHMKWA